MAAPREVLGHIDCPACGTAGGMRVTLDKNAEPFGFCEARSDGATSSWSQRLPSASVRSSRRPGKLINAHSIIEFGPSEEAIRAYITKRELDHGLRLIQAHVPPDKYAAIEDLLKGDRRRKPCQCH